MKELEVAEKNFLKVREILIENQKDFALARAYKKPFKWYIEHSLQEACEILISEAN